MTKFIQNGGTHTRTERLAIIQVVPKGGEYKTQITFKHALAYKGTVIPNFIHAHPRTAKIAINKVYDEAMEEHRLNHLKRVEQIANQQTIAA